MEPLTSSSSVAWHFVVKTKDIPPGTIHSAHCFGKDLVVFQGESGGFHVADAHCPHLGAHLGIGGKIVNDTIRCPFHGWRYDLQGQCVDVPYCDLIPKNAKLHMYPTREEGDSLFAYYPESSEREPASDSRYPFTAFPKGWFYTGVKKQDLANGKEKTCRVFGNSIVISEKNLAKGFSEIPEKTPIASYHDLIFAYHGGMQTMFAMEDIPLIPEFSNAKEWLSPFELAFEARTHIQEIVENALDLAHFSRVHKYIGEPELKEFNIHDLGFTVSIRAQRKMFGILEAALTTITYYGMGIVHTTVETESVKVKVLLTNTPVDKEHTKFHYWVAIRKSGFLRNIINRIVLPMVVKDDFAGDIPIWENKLYFPAPKLCKAETDILRIRKWASQFY